MLWYQRSLKKYGIETEPILIHQPCPVVDYKGKPFRLIEHVVKKNVSGCDRAPYAMTGAQTPDSILRCVKTASVLLRWRSMNSSIRASTESTKISVFPPFLLQLIFIRGSCAIWKAGKSNFHITNQLQWRGHYE